MGPTLVETPVPTTQCPGHFKLKESKDQRRLGSRGQCDWAPAMMISFRDTLACHCDELLVQDPVAAVHARAPTHASPTPLHLSAPRTLTRAHDEAGRCLQRASGAGVRRVRSVVCAAGHGDNRADLDVRRRSVSQRDEIRPDAGASLHWSALARRA